MLRLPWRVAAVVAAGVAAWLATARVAPNLAVPAGVTVAVGLGWLLRFRSSPDTVAWRRGRERRTAGSSPPSSGKGGRSCTTWPSPARRPTLGPERIAWLADRARLRFRPAA
jgi:hypothetical protein